VSSGDGLSQLTNAIVQHVATLEAPPPSLRSDIAHLEESVRKAVRQPFTAAPSHYAALLERALENARLGPVAEVAAQLTPVHSSLPWVYHYEPRSVEEDLSDRIAFAELVGPDGPMRAPHCRIGFTLMAERTTYPMHCHPAVELYLVMTGCAQWQTPTSNRRVRPGEFVLHASNEPHAMRTFDEPLLALWSWSGDIDTPAAYT